MKFTKDNENFQIQGRTNNKTIYKQMKQPTRANNTFKKKFPTL